MAGAKAELLYYNHNPLSCADFDFGMQEIGWRILLAKNLAIPFPSRWSASSYGADGAP